MSTSSILPIHLKSSSMGSDHFFNRKSSFRASPQGTSPIPFLGSLPQPSLISRTSLNEVMQGFLESPSLFLGSPFPNTSKNYQRLFKLNGTLGRGDNSENPRSPSVLSPVTPSVRAPLGGSLEKRRKPDVGKRRIFGSDGQEKIRVGPNKLKKSKYRESLVANELEGDNKISGETKTKEEQEKEYIQRELAKKEMIVALYEKLLNACKKYKRGDRREENNASIIKEVDELNLFEERVRLNEQRRTGSLKARKIVMKGEVRTANNSSSFSLLAQKSTQPTLNKTSFLEKLDSKLNLRGLDSLQNKDESSSSSPISFKKSVTMKEKLNKNNSPSSYKLKTGASSLYRTRKVAKFAQEKSITRSEVFHQSLSPSLKCDEQQQHIKLGDTNSQYMDEASFGELSTPISQPIQSRVLQKIGDFDCLCDRFSNVMAAYQKQNDYLCEQIKGVYEKILEVQKLKKSKEK